MSSDDAVGPITALKLVEDVEYLSTGCSSLDLLLRGGISTRSITEICGPSSSGKTQICFQLCCTVQLPLSFGGLDGAACYITNDFNVQTERLKDIGKYIASKQEYESLSILLIFMGIFFSYLLL